MAKAKAAKKTKKGMYMIECVSTHRMRYCVQATPEQLKEIVASINGSAADDGLTCHDLEEFSQVHLGEMVVSTREMSGKTEFLKAYDEDNSYFKSWTEKQKLKALNKK